MLLLLACTLALARPLLGPQGPVRIAPRGLPPVAGRIEVLPAGGPPRIERTDLAAGGDAPEVALRRRWTGTEWAWAHLDRLEPVATGLRLEGWHGPVLLLADRPRDEQGRWPAGTRFRSADGRLVAWSLGDGWHLEAPWGPDRYDAGGRLAVRGDPANPRLVVERRGGEVVRLAGSGTAIALEPDAFGRPASARTADGGTVRYRWDGPWLASVEGPAGGRLVYLQGAAGELAGIVLPDGRRLRLTWDGSGRLDRVDGPPPHRMDLHWREDGLLAVYGDGSRLEVSRAEGSVRVRDGSGRSAVLLLDGDRVAGWVDPAGRLTRLATGEDGVVRIDGPAGSWTLDPDRGRLVSPGGNTWTWRGREAGLLEVVDPAGGRRRWRLDDHGRVVAQEGPGPVRGILRDARGRPEVLELRDGGRLRLAWGAGERLVGVTDPTGRVLRMERDAAGRLLALVDREGSRWDFRRDGLGRLAAIQAPDGRQLRLERDRAGRLVRVAPEGAAAWALWRGAGGRLTGVGPEGGPGWGLVWSRDGSLAAVRLPDGTEVGILRDSLGELIGLTGLGAPLAVARSPAGRATRVGSRRHRWSPEGWWLGQEGPEGALSLERDPAGRVRRACRQEACYALDRDAQGAIRAVRAPEGTWRIERDPLGRPTRVVGPGGATVDIQRDARGLPVVVRWDGGEMRLAHDGEGRLLRVATASTFVSTIRDPVGQPRLVRLADGTRAMRERTAEGGRAVDFVDPSGGTILARRTRPDAAGRLHVEEEDGERRTWRRDPLGAPVAVERGDGTAWAWVPGRVEGPDGSRVRLDPAGLPAAEVPPPGARAWEVATEHLDIERDASGRATRLVGDLDELRVERDGAGRVVGLLRPDGSGWRLAWDPWDRLIEVAEPRGEPHRLAWAPWGPVALDGRPLLVLPGAAWALEGGPAALLDELGRPRVFAGDAHPPIRWSPTGRPLDPPPSEAPFGPGLRWALGGGMALAGDGQLWDPLAGRPLDPPAGILAALAERAALPVRSPWSHPLRLAVELGVLDPLLPGPWTRIDPPAPPLPWLPAEAAAPGPPPLLPPEGALPLALDPVERVVLRAAIAPPIDPLDLLLAALAPALAELPSGIGPRPALEAALRAWIAGPLPPGPADLAIPRATL